MDKENLQKGDIICFGRYLQKQKSSAAAEPLEWIVLETDGKSAKLLSRYGLTSKPYNEEEYWPVTWESCTLRAWLNSEFLKAAFTEEEQQRLATVTVEAEAFWIATETHDTLDKVFILTAEEVEKYFVTSGERICIPTEKAAGEGA